MSMAGFLDERSDRIAQAKQLAGRDAAARDWMRQDQAPEVRLLRFDGWVRQELSDRINWAWAGEAKARRIEQCRIELEGLVIELWRRGWMLDGRRLAGLIIAALDDVAAAQKAGRVRDFWPFYKGAVHRHVGLNAEEIQAQAMSAGAAMAQVFDMLKKKTAALPELIAQRREETIREKQSKQRRQEAQKAADAQQVQLF